MHHTVNAVLVVVCIFILMFILFGVLSVMSSNYKAKMSKDNETADEDEDLADN